MAALLMLGAIVCLRPFWWPSEMDRLLYRAASQLSSDRFAEAERRAKEVLQLDPHSSLAALIAGESALRLERTDDAIRYFRQVEDDGSCDAIHAVYRTGERLLVTNRAQEAEQYLRRALAYDPGHTKANKKLAVLLQTEGRVWESAPFIRRVLLNGQVAKDHMLMVGAIDTSFVEDHQFIEKCLRADSSNCTVLLGQARFALSKSRLEEAERLLHRIVDEHPELLEAQARLGGVLLERGRAGEFLEWRKELPPDAETHPEIWYVEGLWARRNGQKPAAIRCFLEAAVRDPNHSGAIFQLSQLLGNREHTDIADRLAARSKLLSQLHYLLAELRTLNDFGLIAKVVDLMESLGRPLEAAAWCRVVQMMNPDQIWAFEEERRLVREIESSDQFTHASNRLADLIDRNKFPLPDWERAGDEVEKSGPTSPTDGGVRFVDAAADVGIDFSYFNGTTATDGLVHILQATGGGVAVIDYDEDGWPDLYFIQSGPFPFQPGQTQYTNRLFRNRGDGRFEDVSAATGLADANYGQGVAVGDYNSDGFPDLYVANFGGNRLYENLGDGHFRDVTEQAGAAGDRWTTSCVMADLDGDALPEIYAVNYALKDEVLELKCKHEGRPQTCAPTLLTADQDQLYRNLGNGRFQEVTEQSGIVAADGKGLGVVAADFEERGQLNIFIANDTSANFYFRNETAAPGRPLAFREEAVITGVGFDEIGTLQACMGVASGDANADGLLDLFVTNFYAESNVLYQQSADHRFTDATRRANLREPSFHMLGFGTQFIDGELDGWPDLIIANGHIDLTFAHGNPDRMPPQYMRNTGGGNFAELTAESLGPYFQGRYFGRALATLDWNRDGREDVCISHLESPAALLTNTTPAVGNHLAVRLRGVASNRDAIGAIVTVEAGGLKRVKHVIGGDGYLVSNQRQLVFGLGAEASVDRLSIRWPSGTTQVFEQVPPNQEIMIVEGRQLLTLAHPSR